LSSRRRVAILGSTGSVGRNVLRVIAANPDAFDVVSLSALTSAELISDQARRFGARRVALGNGVSGRAALPPGVEMMVGDAALEELASDPQIDLVVNALVGTCGLAATAAAVGAGKRLAIANKESLVMAGDLIRRLASRTGSELVPVDSEHSSIFRCVRGTAPGEVKGVVLTASGGPLRDLPASELARAGVDAVLDHPTWDMGEKITVDSATLANKAMEVIEARWLFDLPLDAIDVVLHRESIVHSFVRLSDGSLLAHLGSPDMRVPIQYALFYPDAPRLELPTPGPADIGDLTFSRLDEGRYPCFDLILGASRAGGTAPCVACVADEVAVGAFLDGRIAFGEISTVIERTLADAGERPTATVDDVLAAADGARALASEVVRGITEDGGRRGAADRGGRSRNP
jgi:1-deoxy-D-xylulose-5-phosphate reductoisomerase